MKIKVWKNRDSADDGTEWEWVIVTHQMERWLWWTDDELVHGYAPTQPEAFLLAGLAWGDLR
jgi:hypothetical protein